MEGKSKRKRIEDESASKKNKKQSSVATSESTGTSEPPSKKTRQTEEEPRTFASTAEWLESEQWSQSGVGNGPDQHAAVASPKLELWLIKAPAGFDATLLTDKELTVQHFTDLKAGQAGSRFTVEVDDTKYAVHAADPGEYKQLIDVIPSSSEQRLLLGKPFVRGFNITEAVEAQELSVVPVRPRPIVPQPSNLRLRFRPPGYVMSTKESKVEEMLAKKHSQAVQVAKHMTPPLRPVPIIKTATTVATPSVDESRDEDEDDVQAMAIEESPVKKTKKKETKKTTTTPTATKKNVDTKSSSSTPASKEKEATTPSSKTKKKKKKSSSSTGK